MQQHQEPGAGRKQTAHAVQLVRAVPFYGYHPDERLFIKIVLYNPGQVTRIATLLQVSSFDLACIYLSEACQELARQCFQWCAVQSGAVMNRSFQPHESHVPFLLQFKVWTKASVYL